MILSNIRILMVAIFITASYRLVPLPFGDAERGLIYSIFVFFASNLKPNLKLDVSFFRVSWPLIAIMSLTLVVDLLLSRTGFFTWIVWSKFAAVMLIASVVYRLSFGEIHRLILFATALLLVQLALITLAPSYFVSTAKLLGIVDPFVSYGQSLTRIYYAYFNANTASYAIYYMILVYVALQRSISCSLLERLFVISILVVLALLTGGRGFIILIAGFFIVWLSSYRSTIAVVWIRSIVVGGLAGLMFYNSVFQLIMLREESNLARLLAMQQYAELILSNPIFGIGIDSIRERVASGEFKPSHNFLIETIGTFGVILGGSLLAYLFSALVIKPKDTMLQIVGIFALLVALLNNTLLTTWGFFPLLFPVLVKLARNRNSGKIYRYQADLTSEGPRKTEVLQ